MSNQFKFFEEILFPYVERENIKHMLHLGDVFDRRKDTNNYSIYEWDRKVFARWADLFETVHIIIGNHDTYFKNTNKVNTPEKLLSHYSPFIFYSHPQEIDFYGVPTLILPWICDENEERSKKLLEESEAKLVFGHLEVIGSLMFRGIENIDRGFDPSVFSRFERVFSGHFHIKSNQKNIDYLGSPYATTWAEAFDRKGFHIFDTKTRKITFIENPHTPFVHIDYQNNTLDSAPDVRNKIVRVLVKEKASQNQFLEYLEALEKQGPAEINVSEQQSVSTLDGKIDDNLDIFSLMDIYVDSLNFESSKSDLKSVLRELYQEAVNLHGISE